MILADEPTAALDSHSGRVVMEMLRGLAHRQDRSVVVVTHDNRVLSYGDRIVRIEDGRILNEEPSSFVALQPPIVNSQEHVERCGVEWTRPPDPRAPSPPRGRGES